MISLLQVLTAISWPQYFCPMTQYLHDMMTWYKIFQHMRQDLEKVYIPSCPDFQRNKSPMTKPPVPLHPLPIPDEHGQSIMMDFIGPLKEDQGFNCILSIMDNLGTDMRIIPT